MHGIPKPLPIKSITDYATIFADMVYDGFDIEEAGPIVYGLDYWLEVREGFRKALKGTGIRWR